MKIINIEIKNTASQNKFHYQWQVLRRVTDV